MPFIKPERRDEIKRLGLTACQDVGDICYIFYETMVATWKNEPRWKTAHYLYQDIILNWETSEFYLSTRDTLIYKFSDLDIMSAANLAWQMFFRNHVLKYEDLKERENGTI